MKTLKRFFIFITVFLLYSTPIYPLPDENGKISGKAFEITENPYFLKADFESDQIVTVANGPTFLKNISRDMKSPGYWISKLKTPDKTILSEDEIKKFNDKTLSDGIWINDIPDFPESIRKKSFEKQIKKISGFFSGRKYLDASMKEISKKTLNKINKNIIFGRKKYINIKYAMTVRYSDVRLFPTDTAFFHDKETSDIDRIQVAGLDLGEPLISIIQTKDKKWTYILSNVAEGWIKTRDIAFTSKQIAKDWIATKNFIIVTDAKSDIFSDKEMKKYLDYARMSSKFPLEDNRGDGIICVKIPASDKKGNLTFNEGYMNSDGVNVGFLKYTQRNVLNQAFKHLNSPYGWGGFAGEQDCSTFVRQVFGCFGFILPRNSSSQIKTGVSPIEINKDDSDSVKNEKIIKNAVGGISLLYLPGHIMIYIGNDKGKPYAIHSIWGTENYVSKNEKTVSFINKVVVSSLDIGDKTTKGSLLERISKINSLIKKIK